MSPWAVEFTAADGGKQTLTTKNIVIAARAPGRLCRRSWPRRRRLPASDTVWNLRELPKRAGRAGRRADRQRADAVLCAFRFTGVAGRDAAAHPDPRRPRSLRDRYQVAAEGWRRRADRPQGETGAGRERRKILVCEHAGAEVRLPFDQILSRSGARRTSPASGEELGIPVRQNKTIETNDYLQTIFPNIYACGDVAGPFQFTHTASHQAWYAAVNALFGRFKKFRADYRVIPWATFTDPEVARVGLSETEAKEKNIAHEVTVYGIDDLDRAIADGEAHGFVKVITAVGKDTILGATIVGEHAGDILVEYVAAMKYGLGLNKILGTIHTYPTMGEANRSTPPASGSANHQPVKLLEWVRKFHAWERG